MSLSLSEVSSSWPLIHYLMDENEYEEIYQSYAQQFVEGVFNPADMVDTYSEYYNLLKDYAYAEETGYTFLESDSDFDQAVAELKTHVQSRYNAVQFYINK